MSTPAAAWPVKLPGTPIELPAIIGGKLVETKSREAIERRNPAHDVAVSRYPRATAADVDAAVAAAAAAAEKRVWSGMSGAQRAKILLDVARRIEENLDEFRRIECLECGKPVTNAEREVRGAIAHWEYAATLARHTYGGHVRQSRRRPDGSDPARALQRRRHDHTVELSAADHQSEAALRSSGWLLRCHQAQRTDVWYHAPARPHPASRRASRPAWSACFPDTATMWVQPCAPTPAST